jgi:hypothetical protein
MRSTAILGLTLSLLHSAPAAAGEKAGAGDIVDRAIAAHGGAALLGKFRAVTGKLKGTFHGFGEAAEFTGDFAAEGSDRSRVTIESDINGQKFRLVHVLNRDKGWTKVDDTTEEMDADDLAEAKEEAYAGWVATLVPLKDRAFTLTPVGEATIDKRPAVGVRASKKGHRDINLYFDKQTSVLVKTESRVKDDTGQEVTEETFFGDYKEAQGGRYAMKLTVKRDGERYMEAEVTECQMAERLDDSVFGRP